jgi:hypothetical protein
VELTCFFIEKETKWDDLYDYFIFIGFLVGWNVMM